MNEIKPGDLITADMLNALRDRIDQMEQQLDLLVGAVGTGPIVVPDLMGQTLAQTQALLSQSNFNLQIGQAIDALGNAIDIDLNTVQLRIVLNQHPMPGVRVASGSTIDIVLSGVGGQAGGGNGDPTNLTPRIDNFVPPTPRIGETVRIEGANFSPFRTQNQVTFNDTPAQVLPASTPVALVVVVPDFNNPPASDETVSVTVNVTTPGGTTSDTVDVQGESSDLPVLETVTREDGVVISPTSSDRSIVVGQTVEIAGRNFGTVEENITVRVGETNQATITSSDLDSQPNIITVTVPRLSAHNSGTVSVTTQLFIQVGDQESLGFGVSVVDLDNI